MFQEQYFFIDTGKWRQGHQSFLKRYFRGIEGSIFGDAWRYQGDGLSCEQRAVEAGIYKARYGFSFVCKVSLKSLRDAQPMDLLFARREERLLLICLGSSFASYLYFSRFV
jgi:hypothetical protein